MLPQQPDALWRVRPDDAIKHAAQLTQKGLQTHDAMQIKKPANQIFAGF